MDHEAKASRIEKTERPETTLETIHSQTADLRHRAVSAQYRLSACADRLLGARPEKDPGGASSGAMAAVPSSHCDKMNDVLEQIRVVITQFEMSLERLESGI